MALQNITDQFTPTPDGDWQATLPPFDGIIYVRHNQDYAWSTVYSHPTESCDPVAEEVLMGQMVKQHLALPAGISYTLRSPRKPEMVIILPVASQTQEDIAQLQNLVQEQQQINEQQQRQLDENDQRDAEQRELDDRQQQQIDANTAMNEAQERGIGEEAASQLVDSVFGK